MYWLVLGAVALLLIPFAIIRLRRASRVLQTILDDFAEPKRTNDTAADPPQRCG